MADTLRGPGPYIVFAPSDEVTQAHVPASNGVVHVIDRVPIPPKR